MVYQDDDTLLKRLHKGDGRAFSDIYSKYVAFMAAEASRHLDDKNAALDIVQEYFIQSWNNRTLHKLELKESKYLKTYLLRSIRNICCRHNLKYKRELSFLNCEVLLEREVPSEHVSDPELDHKIRLLINTLPQMPRKAVTKVYLEELDRKLIIAELGITSKTLSNLLSNGLRMLRQSLTNSL